MSEKLNYDIVVVGAGPAGSSAAFSAAKLGHRVALLEKEESVAQTVRTSGVTWIDSIKEFEIPESCYNPVKNYGFCSPNNQVVISSDTAMAAVLDVRKTYRWLAEKAQKQEAELYTSTTVTGAKRDSNGIILYTTSNKKEIEFHAKIVIDASGFQTVVAKALGLVTQWKRFGAGAEYEVEVEKIIKNSLPSFPTRRSSDLTSKKGKE